MAHVLKFVDDIDSAATVRLDLNSGVLGVREVQWNPPRLLRAVSQNVMRDGGHVGPSSYDLRTLNVSLFIKAADHDEAADYIQDLTRELDRDTNWLMYQPDGATNPVFFKTYRSDFSSLVDLIVTPSALVQAELEIVTDPHALGEIQTISVGTVNNDPAAGSQGCYFDISTAKGDVSTALMLVDTPSTPRMNRIIGRRSGASVSTPVVFQAEDLSANTDTTNPGGGPDSAMSGSGTNNYLRTSFSGTATMANRVTLSVTTDATQDALAGMFRVFAVVRRSSSTGTVNLQASWGIDSTQNASVATYETTSRQVVDVGLVTFDAPSSTVHPYVSVVFQAERASGTSTLDWDCFLFVPADEQLLVASTTNTVSPGTNVVLDSDAERTFAASAATVLTGVDRSAATWVAQGGYPWVRPGVTNRFVWFMHSGVFGMAKADTATVTAYYYPRYTTIRTATT